MYHTLKVFYHTLSHIERLFGDKKVPGENLSVWRQLIFPPLSGNKLRYNYYKQTNGQGIGQLGKC